MAISVVFFSTHFHKILDWGGEKWAKARTQFKRGQVRQSLRPLGELCHPEFVSSISCCFFVLHFSMTLSPLSPSAVSVYVLKQQRVWNLMLLDFSDQKRSKWAVPAGSGWVPSGVCHLAAMVAMELSSVPSPTCIGRLCRRLRGIKELIRVLHMFLGAIATKSEFKIPVVPHKAVAEVSKIGH